MEMKIKPVGMQLGDRVQLFDGAFGWAIVYRISPVKVTMLRPYATVSSGVMGAPEETLIPYVGTEEFPVDRFYDREFVVERDRLGPVQLENWNREIREAQDELEKATTSVVETLIALTQDGAELRGRFHLDRCQASLMEKLAALREAKRNPRDRNTV